MDLKTPVNQVSRVYKMYSSRLQKLGIEKLEDFLYHIPFRYDDYSVISNISSLEPGEIVTVEGKITEIKNEYTRRYMKLQKAKIEDKTGVLDVIWFNQIYIVKTLSIGDTVSLSGKIEKSGNKLIMKAPDFEIINEDVRLHTGRLVPIYPETKGVSSKWLRKQVYSILNNYKDDDFIPDKIIKENNLTELNKAFWSIHFPENIEDANNSKERLGFNELFLSQLNSIIKKKKWEEGIKATPLEVKKYGKEIESFISSLPFELTDAQKKAVEDILEDLQKEKAMNRLLEGDVGSGKTIVAAVGIYAAFLNGFQSVIMAPTEILAQQHFETLSKFLTPLGVSVSLITSSMKKGSDNSNVFVGTHALIYNKVKFEKVGIVIIDEQHRFGVEQRSIIRGKGDNPHLLTMTATPIPRTVALTVYGDLDLSYLNEMPHGRKKVKTWLVPNEKREKAYKWIDKEIKAENTQAFVICPFIEESESMSTVKAAKKEFENLQKEFSDLNLGLLHGKLKSKEKEEILRDFREKKYDILVATPVVEVGIDIPNATIILIEASERFGLAQLHQLRGRVGRSDKQSYCLLFTESPNPKTIERLKVMESIYIGAELAEADLKMRGPGEIFGTRQHGRKIFKVADFSNPELIKKAKKSAVGISEEINKFPQLKERVEELDKKFVSPD